MATVPPSHMQASCSTSYDRLLLRAMALASFIFPLLYLISAVYFLLDPGAFVVATYEWTGGNDVEQFGWLWLAWFAAVPAMLGIARLLRDARPRMAAWGVLLVFIGGLTQVGWLLQMLQRAALQRIPFETYHTMLLFEQSPVYMWSLTVLVWMVGLVMLGIGVWRTAVLPRWVGGLLVVGTLAFFLYQGPGGALSPMFPLTGYAIAALCFLLAFPVAGRQLWQLSTTLE